MLIDTHTHVQFNAFKDDAEVVINRAVAAGVGLILVGTQKDTSRFAVSLAEKFPARVYAAVGLHPIHTIGGEEEGVAEGSELSFKPRREDFDAGYYRGLVQSSQKVVAIGECGLDYYRLPHGDVDSLKSRQKEALLAQIKLADEMNLPVIIHCRDAHEDLKRLISSWVSAGRLKRRGVMHCFTSTYEDALAYIEMGFYISFSGIVTFSKSLAEVASRLALDRILVETDAPYLTPVPFRGKRNEPAYVRYTAEDLAKSRGMSFEELAEATTKNAKNLFKI